MSIADLPALNATLNSIATVLILLGLYFIKTGREIAHVRCMMGAIATSALFLVSYLTYHAQTEHKSFPTEYGEGVRIFYLVMLATHVVLAIAIVPLVLLSAWAGLKDRRSRHRKLVRWTMPMWLYVSVTGVLVYFFVHVWFP